jgi:hypothetical protein
MKQTQFSDLNSAFGWVLSCRILVCRFSSETYKRLCDPNCGLYYESAVYVFSYLQNEIETGEVDVET